MKRIFLYAYDALNLGDDLFIHTITSRYPNVQFYMLTAKRSKKTFFHISNLTIFSKESALIHFLRKLRPSLVARYKVMLEKLCDATVYIGGSIFMEYPTWPEILSWWDYEVANFHFYVLGANFGPYHTEAYRKRFSGIFEKMQDVCFRDQYSYGIFQGNTKVRYAPDILFSYPMPKVPVAEKQLFVSVIDCASRGEGENSLSAFDEHYISALSGLLNGYLKDGFKLVLASFCKTEGDELAIEKLLSAMSLAPDDPRVIILSYNGTNVGEMTTALAESEYVIATRFHAAILALAAGRPVFPIVYSDKTVHVLEDIGFRGKFADLRNREPISYADSRANLDFPQEIDTTSLAEKAQGHFAILDKMLMR